MQKLMKSLAAAVLLCASLAGCAAGPGSPLMLSDNVDIPRFMGKWYVIAVIPTFVEKNAFNAIEEYELTEGGRVATTFTYNSGALDGPLKAYHPTGFISDENPAIWKMQFLWPFKADYRVMYVDDDHTVTIIGREKRDYVWLMSRSAQMDEQTYARFEALIAEQGYDVAQLRKVPHSQPSPG